MRAPRFWRRRDRVPVVELRRSRPLRFGAIMLVVLAIAVYFGFTKHVPFTHGYRLKAVFASTLNVAAKSPVRIAGVTVGQVVSEQRHGHVGLVTMELSEDGLPIHRDATLKIRPRLFLEGSWMVELNPGTPSSPTVGSGYTVPVTQTSDPVQIDQVLDTLNPETRANLQTFVDEYGEALNHKPTAAEDRTQLPVVKGKSGGEAIKDASLHAPGALRGSAIVQQALGGVESRDISKLILAIRNTTRGLNSHEQALGEWVESFDKFLGELAGQSHSLEATVAQLPGAMRAASDAFMGLRHSGPSIAKFASALTPGVSQTGATITAAMPWITQVEALMQPNSLGGVAKSLSEATPALAELSGGQKEFFEQSDLFSRCLTKVFYPAGDAKLKDGKASSGTEAYKEFWYTMVGLAGIGQNFDGNGHANRFLAGGDEDTLVSQPTTLVGLKGEGNKLLGHAPLAPEGTRPRFPATEPPYKPLVPCYTQKVPNFNGPLAQGPADGSGK